MAEDSVYPRGSVKRIRVTDFMSFVGTVVVEGGSRVNVVEGPNGSGKSSLVTALCVGLAGNIKALGRQKCPGDLIRRGCPAFEVEITLSGGPGQPNVVVHRRTERTAAAASRGRKRKRGGGSGAGSGHGAAGKGAAAGSGGGGEEGSEDEDDESDDVDDDDVGAADGGGSSRSCRTTWRLDGWEVKEARVKELSRSMGIHFDNLCQFLPQERVSAFSDLGPSELLASTEEAIGDGALLRHHTQLKQRSADLKKKREELQRARDRLARVEAEQAANKPEYERLQRRNTLRREVTQLRQKVVWLAMERCRHKLAAARAAVAAAQGRASEARQRLTGAQAPLNNQQAAVESAQRAVEAQVAEARSLEGRVAAGLQMLRRLEQKLRSRGEELEGLRSKSDRWQSDVARGRADLERLRAERSALPPGPDPGRATRLAEVELRIQQAAAEVAPLEFQLTQKRAEVEQLAGDILKLEAAEQRRADLREQRLRRLEASLPMSRRLHEWICETRAAGGFRRRVLGPLLLEISPLANPVSAAQLEFIVGRNNLGAVLTEDKLDNNQVQDWIKANSRGRERGNKLMLCTDSAAGEGSGTEQQGYPAGHPSLYGEYGISHTVDELFKASSDLVKTALRRFCGTHTAYVGSVQAEQPAVMTRLIQRTPLRRILTPNMVTLVSTSEYDSTYVTQKIMDLPRAVLLNDAALPGDGEAERQRLEARRQDKSTADKEVQKLAGAIAQRQAGIAAMQAERTQLLDERKRLEASALELNRREAELAHRLARLAAEGDPRAAADSLRAALCGDAEALLLQAHNSARLVAEQHRRHREMAVSGLSLAAASASLAPLKQAVRRAHEGLVAAEREAAAAGHAREQAAERLRLAEARLQEELSGGEGGGEGPAGVGGSGGGEGGGAHPDEAMRALWAQWPDEPEELELLLAAKQAEVEAAQAALRSHEAEVLAAWARREAEICKLRQDVAAGGAQLDAMEADLEARKAAWLPELRHHMAAINDSLRGHFAFMGCAGEVVLREEGDDFDKYAAEIRVQYRPTEPMRPLNRNHHSGGERSVATMLYLMALQGVTTTPFRVVDEINQGMDSTNERKVFNLLVECSSRPDTPQCFLMTPKLIRNLRFNDHVRVQSLKVLAAAQLHAPQPAVAQLARGAEEHEGGGAAAAGAAGGSGGRAAGQRSRQLRAGAAPVLAQLPWQQMKGILFFGQGAMGSRGDG